MEVKSAAAQRWVLAVNADGRFGVWSFAMARSIEDVSHFLQAAADSSDAAGSYDTLAAMTRPAPVMR